MATRKYDSTIARMAGNILSGMRSDRDHTEEDLVKWAVSRARLIVAEVERTEASPLPLEAQEH